MTGKSGRIIIHGDPAINPEWEGVIEELDIESLPIRYITELRLNLKRKKSVIIDVQNIIAQSGDINSAADRVNNIIREHSTKIENIDFKVNISGLQQQVSQAREAFTKKINFKIKRDNAKKKGKL